MNFRFAGSFARQAARNFFFPKQQLLNPIKKRGFGSMALRMQDL